MVYVNKFDILTDDLTAETYNLLRDLSYPHKLSERTYKDLCEIMTKHFSPNISVFRERAECYNAMQKADEAITEWHARIKNLAINCKFVNLDKVLRDKFVTGLVKEPILDKLCEQEFKET
ncbi:hypothetical protein RN001_006095 [Aquatica leii]|uniref:Uncharacterized protein n=1 Tax=Aquatica leii TaxID=1421715 RepID=A0AAN7PHZ9_9COLE|nr:hypothetical protein RN001_006095 [Aquatica leii]